MAVQTSAKNAKFDAGRWLHYVETERPTNCMLVPAFAELIVAHERFAALGGRRVEAT